MPEVVLQDYLEEINQLIEESRLGEAVRHCRAILEQYPRHIDTYRLLGKAYLEQGELQAASDVFHRVLSADPEDFIAHAGMAIVYKQEERLKEAVWHMQRAFEMDPYNGAIQEALKDLYSKRDGLPEGQLPLTRGALARLYVKGELYSQAIAELRELLAEDPTRVDLRALLAEALWRDGQRVDAVEVCLRLLEELPSCIKANAILGEVWMVTDRNNEAAEYVERVFEMILPAHDVLEDDTPAGHLFLTEGAPEIPRQVLVERLAGSEPVDVLAAEADWAFDFSLEESELDEEPEWLEAMQSGEVPAAGPDEPVADSGEVDDADQWQDEAGIEESGESSTHWMRGSLGDVHELGEPEGETDWAAWLDHEEKDESQAAFQQEVISEFEEEGMGATDDFGKSQDDMPEEEAPRQPEDKSVGGEGTGSFDWLDELGDADAEEPAYSEQGFSDDPLVGDAGDDLFSDDIFAEDTFSEESGSEEAEQMAAGELPDWLAEDAGVLADSDSSLDWLEDDEASEPVTDDVSTELESADVPDWLSEDAAGSSAETAEEGAGDDLSWLDELAAGEGSAIEEPPTMTWPEDESAETPEPAAEDPLGASVEEEVGVVQSAADEEAEAVDELTEAQVGGESIVPEDGSADMAIDEIPAGDSAEDAVAMDDVPEDLDDAMAWLEQLAAQQGAPVEELPSLSKMEDADEEAVLEQMPADIGNAMDWLDELIEGDDAAEPAELAVVEDVEGEEELDWLQGFGGPADAAEAMAVPEVAGEELSWLEGLGGPSDSAEPMAIEEDEDFEPVEEPVTPVSAAALEELEDEDSEALDWLDELVSEDVEQEPEAVTSEPVREEGAFEASSMSAAEEGNEAPEDLDDALDWLEELAARQGAPAEELPSLQDDSGAVEEAPQEEVQAFGEEAAAAMEANADDDLDWLDGLEDEDELDDSWLDELEGAAEEQPQPAIDNAESDEIPEDIDEAMAWLEQLAARQGAPADELPSLEQDITPAAAGAGAMAELEDIPDDPEEALAWLEQLAEGEAVIDDETQVVDEPSTPAVPHDVVAARAEAEAILMHDEMESGAVPSEAEIFDDIPEDPDEAMAWLEKLAARQGAPLDELPSVTETDEEVETPEWIAREAAESTEGAVEAAEESADEPAAPDFADLEVEELEVESENQVEPEAADAVAEVEEDYLTESEQLADELTAELGFGDEQLEEAMPDWLSLDADKAEEGGFDWDEVEGDVAGWLRAEEEATQHEMEIPDLSAASADIVQPDLAEEEEVAGEEQPVMETDTQLEATHKATAPSAPVWEQPGVENERLAAARKAIEAGDLDAAATTYSELVNAGEDLNRLISDLEGAVTTQDAHSRLRTVLGDAYMRNGQLQKALDAYRQALDSL